MVKHVCKCLPSVVQPICCRTECTVSWTDFLRNCGVKESVVGQRLKGISVAPES